jgi:hypothetical protein
MCPRHGYIRWACLMANPTEYKTVQARILAYAQEIGWTFVWCAMPTMTEQTREEFKGPAHK